MLQLFTAHYTLAIAEMNNEQVTYTFVYAVTEGNILCSGSGYNAQFIALKWLLIWQRRAQHKIGRTSAKIIFNEVSDFNSFYILLKFS